MQLLLARTLEMNGVEFEEEVRRALDENPALEIVDGSTSDSSDSRNSDDADFRESAFEMQQADYAGDDDRPDWTDTPRGMNDHEWMINNYGGEVAEHSLLESLRSQLYDLDLDKRQRAIAEYMIGDIDSNGYMTRTPVQLANDLAINYGIDADVDELKQLLNLIRQMEPAGVGAMNLAESLELQLLRLRESRSGEDIEDGLKIVRDHFDLFTRKHFDQLSEAMKVGKERVKAAVELVRSLNPKPGASFGESSPLDRLRHITPDFEVEPDGRSGMTLTMPNSIPALTIETTFRSDSIAKGGNRREAEAARSFIKSKRDEASDFIKALEMRRSTLWNVMTAILNHQSRFFQTGQPSDLRPMILRDIEAATGYDLSVISRATTGKYVATPHGIYPLKFFFNERPKEQSDTTSHEILEELRKLIDNEDKHHPLSDQALMEKMAAKGYDIARRTVTKYREKGGYPVARLRREL